MTVYARLAIWGFSASGGHILAVAARNPDLAATIAQTPLADAAAAMPAVVRYATPAAQLRLIPRGALDALGGLFGREPLLARSPASGGPYRCCPPPTRWTRKRH
jgi:hypothetical protein